MRHDRLFVRHRDVASAPVGVVAARGDIVRDIFGAHEVCAILALDIEFPEPEIVNRRRLRLGDRIADHFGVGLAHAGSFPNSRKAPSTGRSGMPSTVNMSPSMLSNSCGPSASMRNTPTHWLTSGHSAAR